MVETNEGVSSFVCALNQRWTRRAQLWSSYKFLSINKIRRDSSENKTKVQQKHNIITMCVFVLELNCSSISIDFAEIM